jgi:hypothetical protein
MHVSFGMIRTSEDTAWHSSYSTSPAILRSFDAPFYVSNRLNLNDETENMPPNILRRIPSSLKLLLTKSAANGPTFLSLLPEDILLETARHLPSVDLLSLALTVRAFYLLGVY